MAAEVSEKLIRRHPHVFASSRADTTDAVLTQWDKIKRQEKGTESTPYLHGTGKGLPALLRAWKLQKKAAKAGFDWPDAQGALDKVKEETAECEEILPLPEEDPRITEELGDLLFSVVNLCRKKGIDPEVAMTGANKKFERRFNKMERLLAKDGLTLDQADLDAMEARWQQAKSAE